jgi:excinuclease UvrABC helicase subunit UvrB
MALTRVERERITDSRLKIQAIANSLKDVDPKKVPDFEEIEKCLKDADKSLGGALRSSESDPPKVRNPQPDRQALVEQLRAEVEAAQAALKQASALEKRTALERLHGAVQKLNDFVLHGKLPGAVE